MRATLVVVGGKTDKRRVLIDLPATIGRSREADLTVAHPMVSRKHCELYEADGLLMVRDLGSLNGTLVAQEKVTDTPLRPDDEFSVGPLTFRVEYEYAGQAFVPAPPPPVETPPATEAAETPPVGDTAETDQVTIEPAWESAAPAEPEPEPPPLPPSKDELDGTIQVESPQGIAPSDGQLPDFSRWESIAAEQAIEADTPQPDAEVPAIESPTIEIIPVDDNDPGNAHPESDPPEPPDR